MTAVAGATHEKVPADTPTLGVTRARDSGVAAPCGPVASTTGARQSGASAAHLRAAHLHNLQRTAGNRATARLMQSAAGARARSEPPTVAGSMSAAAAGVPTADAGASVTYPTSRRMQLAAAAGTADDAPRDELATIACRSRVGPGALTPSGPHPFPLQRTLLGIPDFAADELADVAANVPGFTLLTVVVRQNPITERPVAPTPENLLGGLMGLVPFGTAIYDQLVELGIVQRAFDYVRGELARFDLSLARLGSVLEAIWNEISITDSLSANIAVAQRHLGQLVRDIEGFAQSLVTAIIELVKEAAIGFAEEHLADSPTWALMKKVLHHDPLRDVPVEATTAEIIEDFLKLIGKEQELQQMKEKGVVEQAAAWLDTQLGRFSGLLAQLRGLFDATWSAIQPENIAQLGSNLQQLVPQVEGFLRDVTAFAADVALQILQLVKDAVLSALDDYSNQVPGYYLLTVFLGRNPVKDVPVERTPQNLIRGFFALLPNGEATYERLASTGRIDALVGRIQGAMDALDITWDGVVTLFTEIWDSVHIEDLADPIATFERIRARFGEPIGRLVQFVATVVKEMLSLLLDAMNFPSEMVERIIANAMAAYEDIRRDPLHFLENVLAAVKRGFTLFFDHIGEHLLRGLTDWLFSTLKKAGIQPPAAFTLEAVLDFVLQVLGISMEQIWKKLGQRIGDDKVAKVRAAADTLTGVWRFIKDVQERGVAAIWEYIESQISNLWNTVLDQIKNWIMEQIIDKVVAKLLSMLDPTGIMAVVNSFIAFFKAVQSAIEYAREMLAIVDRYVATIAAVARGDIEPGAAKLEEGLGASVPVAIGFLANQVGLGGLAERIAEIVAGLRELVDKALDWLMDRCVAAGTAILGALGVGAEPGDEPVDPKDHNAFAEAAATKLAEKAATAATGSASDPSATMAAIRAAARTLEPELSAQLESGVGLRFVFAGGDRDAEDGEVGLEVVIAPNDARVTKTIKLPGKGHAHDAAKQPLIGRVGPYHSLEGLQDARSDEIPQLALYREHVIPRDAIGRLGRGLTGPGAPRQGELYQEFVTVLLYQGGKADKDAKDPKPSTVDTKIDDAKDDAASQPNTSSRRMKLHQRLTAYVDDLTTSGADDALDAALKENDANGAARGTEGDPQPPHQQILAAAQRQAAQVKEFLDDALEVGLVARDFSEDAIAIATQVANRCGGSTPDSHRDYRTDIPLGARGGTGTGTAVLTITAEGWSLRSPGRTSPRTPIDAAAPAIAAIVDAIGTLRAEAVTGMGSFTDEYRTTVVAAYTRLKPAKGTQSATAEAVLQEIVSGSLVLPSGGRQDPPAASTITEWARDAGQA